jgi:hypothetical protein
MNTLFMSACVLVFTRVCVTQDVGGTLSAHKMAAGIIDLLINMREV